MLVALGNRFIRLIVWQQIFLGYTV